MIFQDIEQSYFDRCHKPKEAQACWENFLVEFPPDRLEDYNLRPSLNLAKEAGDLGLALFWNAQASLIRPLLKAFLPTVENSETIAMLSGIAKNAVGALAISESKDRPLIVTKENGRVRLDGEKKYITGGRYADFLLMTSRSTQEEKLSSILFLPVCDIQTQAFEDLDLGCLCTSSQARLTLDNYHLPMANLVSDDTSVIRKRLRVWGMIEQSIIVEAMTGLTLYLAERVFQDFDKRVQAIGDVEAGLFLLSGEIDGQIASAQSGDFVRPLSPISEHLIQAMKDLKTIHEGLQNQMPDELLYRFKDLFYFSRHLML